MSLNSAIYVGHVVHRRYRPKKHVLKYRVFSLLIDLEDLPALDRLRLFGCNRPALFSFSDGDHGNGLPPRSWVSRILEQHGLPRPGRVYERDSTGESAADEEFEESESIPDMFLDRLKRDRGSSDKPQVSPDIDQAARPKPVWLDRMTRWMVQ